MPLDPGTRLGPYEILSPIGAGGMGEVYRARDTRLERDVAVKVLPELFAADQDRLARFEREAKTLASLNHPNIATIHGIEESAAVHALVMELVEGPTLSDRISHGPIPLDETLAIARQIAEALEAAHERGVIHRDLKPANVKLTSSGQVKVLDFGLAKMLEGERVGSALSMSPTLSLQATYAGVILGTAAYMAPEQARGKTVDKRADIWAFGCVLFEMLTGHRAFDGDDATELLGAVIHKEPDWTKVPRDTPAPIRRLLRRCLTKDPRQRMHDVADARIEIESVGAEEDRNPSDARRGGWRRYWWAAALVMIASMLVGLATDRLLRASNTNPIADMRSRLMRASIDLPGDAPLALGADIPAVGYNSPVLALSPDGAWLAYVGKTASGRALYLRDMSTGEVRPLPGTDGAIHPFFSPDGQWFGFLTPDHVKKVRRAGGTVISLCEADTPVLAWWRQPDQIYFTEMETSALSRVPADGGKPERMVTAPALKVNRFADVLPDGEHVLAVLGDSISGDTGDIVRVNLRTRETKLLVRSGYAARYVEPGYVLFARAGNLMAERYDAGKGETIGEPVTLAAGVGMESLFGMLHAGSSSTGVAAYAPGGDLSVGKLAWIDRRGTVEYLEVPERVYGAVDLRPDGTRLAVPVADVRDYIWVWDFTRREGRRVVNQTAEVNPLWSPDGRQLASRSSLEPRAVILHDVQENGAIGEGRVLEQGGRFPVGWSPQGDVLAIEKLTDYRTEFLGLGKAANVAGFNGIFPTFSPDGRWIAYESTETGSAEVFIRSYPEGRVIGQVSNGGGVEPRWKQSGLFYRNGHRWFSTSVSTVSEPRWDPPRPVFDTEFIDTPGLSYDISRDGQRLLVVKRARQVSPSKINLVINWPDALARAAITH